MESKKLSRPKNFIAWRYKDRLYMSRRKGGMITAGSCVIDDVRNLKKYVEESNKRLFEGSSRKK